MNFPFVVNLLGTFQDSNFLYLVLEYVVGGEFFTHLRMSGRYGIIFPHECESNHTELIEYDRLDEDAAKVYAAQVLLVFEYLHSRDIIYRDLKVRKACFLDGE